LALRARCAGVAIVTKLFIGCKDTVPRLTGVIGARIAILAGHGLTAHTLTGLAAIADGTGVAITAWTNRREMHTTRIRKTAVRGASISIIARKTSCAATIALKTAVVGRASVAVITIRRIGRKDAVSALAHLIGT